MSRWRRIGLVLSLVVLVLVLVVVLGPRVKVDTTLRPIDLPNDLDAYLATAEARYADIVPGAERRILWAGEPGVQTEWAVVYLHGFSATRQETAPLAAQVASSLGANLYEARLAGHGRSGEAMAEATVNDWFNDANEALAIGRRLGRRVLVIGVSTGGTLAAWLVQAVDDTDVAVVLISPNFTPRNTSSEMLTWPWGQQLAELLIGRERSWEPSNEGHALYWTHRYPTRALLPMMGLVKHVRALDWSTVGAPLLVLYSPLDEVVDHAWTKQVFEQWGAAEKQLLVVEGSDDPSNHVLAGDIMSPSTTQRLVAQIVQFVQQLP